MSIGRLLAQPLVWLVRAYQLLISPLTPPSCRYYPSCSAYAVTALERFGPVKGTYLAVWRVLRCNPWSPGGVDHVPPKRPRVRDGSDSAVGAAQTGPHGQHSAERDHRRGERHTSTPQ